MHSIIIMRPTIGYSTTKKHEQYDNSHCLMQPLLYRDELFVGRMIVTLGFSKMLLYCMTGYYVSGNPVAGLAAAGMDFCHSALPAQMRAYVFIYAVLNT